MSKRAIVYARVSRDDRDTDGRNLAGQLAMGREYCMARGHIVLLELAEDARGASGAEIDLPQLLKIREKAQAGEFDVLVVREIDRLSRNLAKQLIVEAELKKAGVTIEYVIGEYPDTPEGNFMKHVRASVAEFEREKICERNTRGKELKVKAGSVMTYGKAPYGYRPIKQGNLTQLEIVEAEAVIVRLIFDWYTVGEGDGPLGTAEIRRRLNALNVLTPSMSGGDLRPIKGKRGPTDWALRSLYGILKNETYAGVWHFNKSKRLGEKERLPVNVPAIVSRAQWEAAQEQLALNRAEKAGKHPRGEFLITRRVKCAKCNGSVTVTTITRPSGLRFTYYLCRNHNSQALKFCNVPYWRAVDIDARIWEWIKVLVSDPTTLVERMTDSQTEQDKANKVVLAQLEVADGLIAENKSQRERLADMYELKIIERGALVERDARLKEALTKLEEERAKIAAKLTVRVTPEQMQTVMEFAAEVRERLPYADKHFAERRRLIEALDVRATLEWEGDKWAINADCWIGKARLVIDSKMSKSQSTPPCRAGRPAAGARPRSARRGWSAPAQDHNFSVRFSQVLPRASSPPCWSTPPPRSPRTPTASAA